LTPSEKNGEFCVAVCQEIETEILCFLHKDPTAKWVQAHRREKVTSVFEGLKTLQADASLRHCWTTTNRPTHPSVPPGSANE